MRHFCHNFGLMGRLALLLAALAGLAGCSVNPISGMPEINILPQSRQIELGAQAMDAVTQVHYGLVPDDPDLQLYVAQVGQRLAATSLRPNLPWEFRVVNDGVRNIYALPGGKIVIPRGMLRELNSEGELAAVLAHAIGHVEGGHSVSFLNLEFATAFNAAASGKPYQIRPDEQKAQSVGGTWSGRLYVIRFNTWDESQAEKAAFANLVRNGYYPLDGVSLWGRLLGRLKRESWRDLDSCGPLFTAHPMNEKVLQESRERAAREMLIPVDRERRQADFDKAMSRQSARARAYFLQARADQFVELGIPDMAEDFYAQSIAAFDRDQRVHARLAQFLLKRGRYSEALREAKIARELAPGLFFAWLAEGIAYLKLAEDEQAVASLEKAQSLMPTQLECKLYLGEAYERVGQKMPAVIAYRKVALSDEGDLGRAAHERLVAMGYWIY
ncbi:MAG: M48 family metalloprotease [Pseudomonadota bacterium]